MYRPLTTESEDSSESQQEVEWENEGVVPQDQGVQLLHVADGGDPPCQASSLVLVEPPSMTAMEDN